MPPKDLASADAQNDHIRNLQQKVERTLAQYPDANPENVMHTLLLLNEDPWQRLKRSLIRGRRGHLLSQ